MRTLDHALLQLRVEVPDLVLRAALLARITQDHDAAEQATGVIEDRGGAVVDRYDNTSSIHEGIALWRSRTLVT